jgi:hypothetical protein
MATWQTYRTARKDRPCDDYPHCRRGIKRGERYMRCAATPNDAEVNASDHWWVLNICCEHMRPEVSL